MESKCPLRKGKTVSILYSERDESTLVFDEPFSGSGSGYHETPSDALAPDDSRWPGAVQLDPEDDLLIEQQQDAEQARLFALEPLLERVSVTRTVYKSKTRNGKTHNRPGWSVVVASKSDGEEITGFASDTAGEPVALEEIGDRALAKWREVMEAQAAEGVAA